MLFKTKVMKKFTTIIGIDVSKKKLDICIIRKGTEKFISLSNDRSSFDDLESTLREDKARKSSTLICLEHTGIYGYPICFFLAKRKWNYSLIPGMAIQKSLGIQRGKTDKADAKSIARYGNLFQEEIPKTQLPEEKLIRLKMLFSYRERLLGARKSIQVASGELEGFVEKKLLNGIINDSNGLVKSLNRKIKKVNDQMETLINSDEHLEKHYRLSISVPGVGPQTAIYFIITTRGYSLFRNWKKLACYSGVAPFAYSSGSSIRGRTRVSHLANKKAKSLLSMAAINSIRCDSQMKSYYERKVKEGKNPMSVVNAVRNKILARLFATVQRGTPFVPVANYLK